MRRRTPKERYCSTIFPAASSENPLTGMNTEPSGWIAYPPGMIGYKPVMEMDFCVGFEITGAGCNSLYVHDGEYGRLAD